MPRKCNSSPSSFSYIYEEFTFTDDRCSITMNVEKLYNSYFGIKLRDQNKGFASLVVCISCTAKLLTWYNKKLKSLLFGVLMIWKEQKNHHKTVISAW